jgi:hypothetical protein
MSNFHFDLSLKFSQGEVHDVSGEVQKFSGEVQSDLRGGAHPPHPPLQNPAMFGSSTVGGQTWTRVATFYRKKHYRNYSNKRLPRINAALE